MDREMSLSNKDIEQRKRKFYRDIEKYFILTGRILEQRKRNHKMNGILDLIKN